MLGPGKRERLARPAMETPMQADGDVEDQEARQVTRRGAGARERAAVAKERELAAHQRAIELHEQAAKLQERLGHPDRAVNARQHAQHARELLAKGRAEQREQKN
jgi:hypothetical protein